MARKTQKTGKGGRKSGNAARKTRRASSWFRCHGPGGKKDRNVERSSHGMFLSVAALQAGKRSR